jgi:hypothetical protein
MIKLDDNGEYPLIKRDFIREAYDRLQKEARVNCISSVAYEPWRKAISTVFDRLGKKDSVTFKTLKKWIGEEDDLRAKEFAAYCFHLGIFICENKNVPLPQRNYIFPILFQKNWG